MKNIIIVILTVIIIGSLALSAYTICKRNSEKKTSEVEKNPNVTFVTAPKQTDFEIYKH